jgi:hypothetical protein
MTKHGDRCFHPSPAPLTHGAVPKPPVQVDHLRAQRPWFWPSVSTARATRTRRRAGSSDATNGAGRLDEIAVMLRSGMGDEAFASAVATGRALSDDEVLAIAREHLTPAESAPTRRSPPHRMDRARRLFG